MGKIDAGMESMLDMFVFETSDLLAKLDDILMRTEQDELGADDVGEIFRVMHTVKGSAAMMGLQNMSVLAHALEDLFSLIRDDPNIPYDKPAMYELLYEGSDGLKNETENLNDDSIPLTDFSDLTARIHAFADVMKGAPAPAAAGGQQSGGAPKGLYESGDGDDVFAFKISYKDTCAMPDLRAMVLLGQIDTVAEVLKTLPADLDDDDAGDVIAANGFFIKLRTDKPDNILDRLRSGLDVANAELVEKAAPAGGTQSAGPAAPEGFFDGGEGGDVCAFKITYKATCAMPDLRAMVLLGQIESVAEVLKTVPADLDADNAGDEISANGFFIKLRTDNPDNILERLRSGLDVEKAEPVAKPASAAPKADEPKTAAPTENKPSPDTTPAAPAPAQPSAPAAQKKQQDKGGHGGDSGAMISVKLEKLDRLMRLTQELVIAESGVMHNKFVMEKRREDPELDKAARELKKLTDELQDNVMAVRMVPVGGAFSKMNRVVRDMNKTLGKGVKLVLEGENTEVDKSVADMLGDPLMHLVRNAVDHGIETPEDRKASGKIEEPTVRLAAFYDSGDAVITVTDNGYGMDPRKLLAKGREKGILTKPESEYTDQDCFDLIMAAGFSTNTEVTQYSGRGVGMDVVKKNLEKVGGALLVTSKLGQGSVFTIRVPMSLSISDCMGVMIGGQEFALPVQTMEEAFRADPKLIVRTPDGKVAVRRHGENRLYRVISLADHFGLEGAEKELDRGIMLLCKGDHGAAALFADSLTEDMQLVVKPFSPYLASYGLKEKGLTGTSVLGDGSILIVIDPGEIMKDGEKQ